LSRRHVPDAEQLRQALSGAFALCEEAGRKAGEPLDRLLVDHCALERLARAIDELIRWNNSTDPESFVFLLADVAVAVYLDGVAQQGYWPTHAAFSVDYVEQVRTEFAIACVALLAHSRRHVIPLRQISLNETKNALKNEDKGQLVRIFQHALGIRQHINGRGQVVRKPVPRALIAIPHTKLNGFSYRLVQELASDASRTLTSSGIAVIKPDPSLTPSAASDRLPDELAREERLLITGSDLLVAVGAEHDSWGVSRSVSWAEACGSVVILTSTKPCFLSRVLSSSPHRVCWLDEEEKPGRLLQDLEDYVKNVYPIIEGHARDRLETSRRVSPVVTEARERLRSLDDRVFERSLLTLERTMELLEHPVLFNQASQAEMREFRRLLGSTGDTMIDATLGRRMRKAGSFMPVPAGRGLSAESYSNLLSVANAEEWSDARVVRLVEEYLSPALPAHLRYRDDPVSGAEWRRLNGRVFGSGDKVLWLDPSLGLKPR
jgi:hypothetical protein